MISELGTHHDGDSTLIEFHGYTEYHDYRRGHCCACGQTKSKWMNKIVTAYRGFKTKA